MSTILQGAVPNAPKGYATGRVTDRAHFIVLGNEKGGSGKSTTAMHVVTALMVMGHSVATIDLDGRQRSLTRYMENRKAFIEKSGLDLPQADFHTLTLSQAATKAEAEQEEIAAFQELLDKYLRTKDFIVIDCPGSDTHLARLGHSIADTLITPMNDSFVDFDLLGRIDSETYEVIEPSFYAELVWDSRKRRMMRDRRSIDWIVMRNRLQQFDAKNKQRVGEALNHLSSRIGFRVSPGFNERVIYRELFPKGLTLLDLKNSSTGIKMSMSHVAARNEVRELLTCLELEGVSDRSYMI